MSVKHTKNNLIQKNLSVEIIKNKDLTNKHKMIINHARVSHWGEAQRKDFSKDYEPNTLWFFIKNKGNVVSLGGIRPIKVRYLGKNLHIGGICSTISMEKRKGYGKIMISYMIDYSLKTGKTIIGFTGEKNLKIFEKTGLRVKKDFIRRFVWTKPNGEPFYDNDGHGVYYEGKDRFITKLLKTKNYVYINVIHW
ncbi:hypothetical protein J4423_00015 [Candidatus Pacearchaeota archaeon]|nr:hypothetical protein [Candidatus Pacearchaeota archaeon]